MREKTHQMAAMVSTFKLSAIQATQRSPVDDGCLMLMLVARLCATSDEKCIS